MIIIKKMITENLDVEKVILVITVPTMGVQQMKETN